MPRRRKTQSGADAQRIESVAGQRYGEGVAQQQMQRVMPSPNLRNEQLPAPAPSSPVPSRNEIPAQSAPVDVEQYLRTMPKGLLKNGQTTNYITDGLVSGPGAGPEVMGSVQSMTPLRRTIEQLYKRTNDPAFRRLLERGNL